ncbi:MAG: hypothetical protein FOGNACKC_00869 [Anaerolineae bacterium]|nr:hypothetical protein [Anaerolineae bacterium]
MATRKFDQIVDSRFGQGLPLLEQWTQEILAALAVLPGVVVSATPPRFLKFSDSEPCTQWRRTFYVTKTGRRTTWNQVFAAVNKIKPAAFDKMG